MNIPIGKDGVLRTKASAGAKGSVVYRGGITIVMATHSAACAAIADEIVYLADGLRIEVDQPSAVRA